MYILLSSHYRQRYREDILRCLAAPIDTTVQFRYDKNHVSDTILQKAQTLTGKAIVCYVNTELDDICTMIPVREVEIKEVNLHGSTLSVILRVKAFVGARDISVFTKEVTSLSGGSNPNRKNGDVSGLFFFEISGMPNSAIYDGSIAHWEKIVEALCTQEIFRNEPFFFGVVGLFQSISHSNSTERFSPWPQDIESGKQYDLAIYQYHPSAEPKVNERNTLCVQTGNGLQPIDQNEIAIDSRYDLKRWRFEISSKDYRKFSTTIRLQTNKGWALDLTITIKNRAGYFALAAITIGGLVAAPAIINTVSQHWSTTPWSAWVLVLVSLLELVFGLGAGFAAVYKLSRID